MDLTANLTSMDLTDQALACFKSFNILFDNENAVYAPGEELSGKIFIHSIKDVQISPISLSFKGYGTLCNQSDETLLETVKYWDRNVDLGVGVENIARDKDYSISFKETLPLNLETSIESKVLTISYSVKAHFTYKSSGNDMYPLSAIRGFTIISPVKLDYLDLQYFKPSNYAVNKKYGFLCTFGHIGLKISVERTAYVNGENFVLEGHIENDSKRRVDSVVGIMQKVIEVVEYSSPPDLKIASISEKPTLSTIFTEIHVVKKENLAMYIDPHTSTKITRNFAIPTCRPSSLDSIHIGSYLISVTYRLLIKVKQINEICGVCIPIFIGSVPHETCHNKKNPWMNPEMHRNEEERRPQYQRDTDERACSLFEEKETYLSKVTRMIHFNNYPYFPHLTTSAKQSQQFRMLASAVRTENMFMSKIQQTGESTAIVPKKSEQKADQPRSFDSIQPLKPEKLLLVTPKENPLAEFISKANSSIDWSKLRSPKWMKTSKSSLPPVEISTIDSTAKRTI